MGQGKVTQLNWMLDDVRLMLPDAPGKRGSSGAPVLDASGHIVGVFQGLRRGSTESSAVKSHLLKAFLKSNHVEYKTAPSTEELSLSEIKKKSDKFTVMVQCLQ